MPIVLIDSPSTTLPHLHLTLANHGLPITVHPASPVEVHALADESVILLGPGLSTLAMVSGFCAIARAPLVCFCPAEDVAQRVALLQAGAVDVVPTSVHTRELVARLRVRLRRLAGVNVLDVESLRLNPSRRTAMVDGCALPLAPREYVILEHLAHRAGSICTREDLLDAGWGAAGRHGTSLDTHLSNVRRHLRAAGVPHLLRTVRGQGWVLQGTSR